jgi:paraquat-inducible protein B
VEHAIATLDSVRKLSERLDADLPPLIASVKTTSEGAGHTVDVAAQAINRLQDSLNSTLDSLRHLTANTDQRLGDRSADLHAFLTSANQTVLQTRAVLNELKGFTSDRGTASANLEATLRDLAAAAASLRGFTSDIERNPQLLLTGRRP